MEKKKKKFYAVARGRKTGIFTAWFGDGNAESQIRGFAGARYKGFTTIDDARDWLRKMESAPSAVKPAGKRSGRDAPPPVRQRKAGPGEIVMYTDGGCSCNPGPGGYGAVIISGTDRTEISGGFRHTTNNRMELTACIEGLKALPDKSAVLLHSDSRYVVNGISKGWAKKWRAGGWMRTRSEPAENYDLWQQLLDLCDRHDVEFVWVKGHAGNPENERCDALATGSAAAGGLPPDTAYESGHTTVAK